MILWRYKMTKKVTKQETHPGKPVPFLIPLDSTLEQCEAIAEAFRHYAREHPDPHDPLTACRLAGSLNTSNQEPDQAEINDENTVVDPFNWTLFEGL
jgi:hypothetical protein